MRSLLLLSFFVIAGCSHGNRKIQENITIADAAKRESIELSEHEVSNEEKSVSFKVKAKKAPQLVFNKGPIPFFLTSIEIGSLTPIECFIYASDISPAAALKNVTNFLLREEIVGKVSEKKIGMIDSGVIDGNPYLMLQTSFRVDEKQRPLIGNVKTIVGTKEIGNVVCAHNEVGYQQTFYNAFSEILKSLNFPNSPKVDVKYKSVMQVKIKDLSIGYIVNYVGLNHYHSYSWVEKSSILIPTNESEVIPMDELTVEVANKNGALMYGLFKSDEDGQNAHTIQLTTMDTKNYEVSGTMGNKSIKQIMHLKEPIYSHYAVTKQISKKLFQENLKSFSIALFSPGKSLTAPSSLILKLDKSNLAGGIVQVNDGINIHHAVVERDGTEGAVTFNFGKIKIEGKRILKQGMFP